MPEPGVRGVAIVARTTQPFGEETLLIGAFDAKLAPEERAKLFVRLEGVVEMVH